MARRFNLNGDESGEWIEISEATFKALSERAWEQPIQEALVEYIEDSEVGRDS